MTDPTRLPEGEPPDTQENGRAETGPTGSDQTGLGADVPQNADARAEQDAGQDDSQDAGQGAPAGWPAARARSGSSEASGPSAAASGQPGGARGKVADAPADNWVDSYAPPEARPFLRLSRADRPIGTWLLLLPCWWGALLGALAVPQTAGWLTVWIVLGCGLGAFLMRGAGCTWNDITDRDIDDKVARTRSRPIPSGQVTVRGALIWMAVQSVVALLILLTFNLNAILLGVLSLGLVAIYPFAKRFTWWPQVFLGLAFNWGALLAWTAQTGAVALPALFLYLAGICWTIFYDTIYAHQDKEDDALIGVKSTALLFGDNTLTWLRGFLVGAVVLMSLAVIYALAPLADPLKMSIGLCAAWAFGAHMNWQLGKLDNDDTETCLRLFRSNRDAGLIVALFLAISLLV